MNDYEIKVPEGSYNYYEEVLKDIKEVLKTFDRDIEIKVGDLLDFIEEVERTL